MIKHNIIDKDKTIKVEIFTKDNFLIVSNNKIFKKVNDLSSKKGIENIQQRVSFFTEEKVVIENTDENYLIKLPILETV